MVAFYRKSYPEKISPGLDQISETIAATKKDILTTCNKKEKRIEPRRSRGGKNASRVQARRQMTRNAVAVESGYTRLAQKNQAKAILVEVKGVGAKLMPPRFNRRGKRRDACQGGGV